MLTYTIEQDPGRDQEPPPTPPARRTVAEELGPFPADILARAVAGDPAAFDDLYARYHRAIRNHVGKLFGHGPDADDLTQDAFLKAWLALRTGKYDTFTNARQFQAWLYRIATNTCLDEIRHRKLVRFERIASVLAFLKDRPRHSLNRAFVSADPLDAPARAVEIQEGAALVADTLAAVPGKGGIALRLYEGGGLTYDDIAESFGTTRAAVKSMIWRARESIRQSVPREVFA